MVSHVLKLVIEIEVQKYLNTTGTNLTKQSLEEWSENLSHALIGTWGKDLSVYGVSITVSEGEKEIGEGVSPSGKEDERTAGA